MYWDQKSAEQGFAEAQYNLGVRYIIGKGVTRNEQIGIEWYRKAVSDTYKAQ